MCLLWSVIQPLGGGGGVSGGRVVGGIVGVGWEGVEWTHHPSSNNNSNRKTGWLPD